MGVLPEQVIVIVGRCDMEVPASGGWLQSLMFIVMSNSSRFYRAHSEQAVIAHVCHGHTLQLSSGLSRING